MSPADLHRFGEIKTVLHLIYEFQKGIRRLVLCTLCPMCARLVTERLERQGIGYLMQTAGRRNINLFFGEESCLAAVGQFIHKPLNQLTPEEDFMLGALLGYDLSRQCQRYCSRKQQLARPKTPS